MSRVIHTGDSFFDGDVEYVPIIWDDGRVGYEVNDDGAPVGRPRTYVYLNPSINDGNDDPNVFIYSGRHGDPALDAPLGMHLVVEFDEISADELRAEAGIMTDAAYENGECAECGNPVRDETGEYAEVSGEPYGRPDLLDVWVHAECYAKRQREDGDYGDISEDQSPEAIAEQVEAADRRAAQDDPRGERDR